MNRRAFFGCVGAAVAGTTAGVTLLPAKVEPLHLQPRMPHCPQCGLALLFTDPVEPMDRAIAWNRPTALWRLHPCSCGLAFPPITRFMPVFG